jgi:hypothetical protein
MIFECGAPEGFEWPDAGEGMCCIGAAVYGSQRCTCWEPIYDQEQAEPRPDLIGTVQRSMCPDCAFRAGSPERTGQPGYQCNSQEEIDDLVVAGTPFFCHQGVRRIIRWRHPSGMVIDAHPGAYAPIQQPLPAVKGDPSTTRMVGFKANGEPMSLCAGWTARRLAFMQRDIPK